MMPQPLVQFLVIKAGLMDPFEICGFVLDGWKSLPIANIATEPKRFYMHEGQLLAAYREHGHEMIGIYHSHPSGNRRPSDEDVLMAPKDMRYWIVTLGEVIEWDMSDDVPRELGSTPYLADIVSPGATTIRSGNQEASGESRNRSSI